MRDRYACSKPNSRIVKFKIRRYSLEMPDEARFDDFEIEVDSRTHLVDAFQRIKDEIDPTLTFRSSCHSSVCGSCTVMANGVEVQSCAALVFELLKRRKELIIEPMRNFEVIRDLVVDMASFFIKLKIVKPAILVETTGREEEIPQSMKNLQQMMSFEACIECGACTSACPIVSTDPHFLGPAALVAAYRSSLDSRDMARAERLEIVDNDHGVWRCHSNFNCVEACPKKVAPALAIAGLRRMILSERIKKVLS